jgi:Asp-tRNA(Asn)/Glu-tRNA(Gln) amidotransferase C subunit
MTLDKADIERLLALAKFERPEPEKQRLVLNLNKVLGEMDIIDKSDGIPIERLTRSRKAAIPLKIRHKK